MKFTVLFPVVERMAPAVSVNELPWSPVSVTVAPPLILKALIVLGFVNVRAALVRLSVSVAAALSMLLLTLYAVNAWMPFAAL